LRIDRIEQNNAPLNEVTDGVAYVFGGH
jgi:hypothetical protein